MKDKVKEVQAFTKYSFPIVSTVWKKTLEEAKPLGTAKVLIYKIFLRLCLTNCTLCDVHYTWRDTSIEISKIKDIGSFLSSREKMEINDKNTPP